jgi:hypothetical protein
MRPRSMTSLPQFVGEALVDPKPAVYPEVAGTPPVVMQVEFAVVAAAKVIPEPEHTVETTRATRMAAPSGGNPHAVNPDVVVSRSR